MRVGLRRLVCVWSFKPIFDVRLVPRNYDMSFLILISSSSRFGSVKRKAKAVVVAAVFV